MRILLDDLMYFPEAFHFKTLVPLIFTFSTIGKIEFIKFYIYRDTATPTYSDRLTVSDLPSPYGPAEKLHAKLQKPKTKNTVHQSNSF